MADLTNFEPEDTPRTAVKDSILASISRDATAAEVEAIKEITHQSIRQAAISGELVDFNTYLQL
jgi:glycine cleavage system H lipoate-binding protein